jgi:hypothetical protein
MTQGMRPQPDKPTLLLLHASPFSPNPLPTHPSCHHSLCLGAPLVGWMAALQHQRVAAKYGLPPAPSLLASCLCYPHTLFQAAAALEEARLLAPPPPKPVPRSREWAGVLTCLQRCCCCV